MVSMCPQYGIIEQLQNLLPFVLPQILSGKAIRYVYLKTYALPWKYANFSAILIYNNTNLRPFAFAK